MIGVMIARYLAGIIIGYFLGSIPWGVIITKRVAKVDVRQYGSGNIGATNVLAYRGLENSAAFPGIGCRERRRRGAVCRINHR